MSIERARAWLKNFGRDQDILEFPVSAATVPLAAEAIGCDAAMIAKTLSFDVKGEPILIVACGDTRIDSPKFKAVFHTRPHMLDRSVVGSLIGHEVGGVCPFGVNPGVKIYLDEALRRFDVIYPACGSENSAIKMTPDELLSVSGALGFIDVCKAIPPAAPN